MARDLVRPRSLRPGDRVAVLSPSWAAPAVFPAVHEQAMHRLRTELDVEPVEYPSTRRASSAEERAADLNAAFADPSIRAVLATIGGDDQITVLRHLDHEAVVRDPTWFVGYSDNTNILNWLWYHGVAGIHGGSTQVHIGPGPGIDPLHLESMRTALFGGSVELTPATDSRDTGIDWADPRALTDWGPTTPAEPWTWSGPARSVTGPVWGGNLEVLTWTLATGRWVLPVEEYAGSVLMVETSEERPPPEEVYRMLRNLGERGLLAVFPALVWARPPVSDHHHHPSREEATALRAENREAVLRAVGEYQPDMVVALDVDVGHTIPQWLVPYGGEVRVDGVSRRIEAFF